MNWEDFYSKHHFKIEMGRAYLGIAFGWVFILWELGKWSL